MEFLNEREEGRRLSLSQDDFFRILYNIRKAKNKDKLIFDILQQREKKLSKEDVNNIKLPKEISPTRKFGLFTFKQEQLQFLVAWYLRGKYISRGKTEEEKKFRREDELGWIVQRFRETKEGEIKDKDKSIQEIYDKLGWSQNSLVGGNLEPLELEQYSKQLNNDHIALRGWLREKEMEKGRGVGGIKGRRERKGPAFDRGVEGGGAEPMRQKKGLLPEGRVFELAPEFVRKMIKDKEEKGRGAGGKEAVLIRGKLTPMDKELANRIEVGRRGEEKRKKQELEKQREEQEREKTTKKGKELPEGQLKSKSPWADMLGKRDKIGRQGVGRYLVLLLLAVVFSLYFVFWF
jgi:hypothetical protein